MQLGFEKLKKNYADVFDEEELRDLLEEDSFKKDVIRKVKDNVIGQLLSG